MNKICHKLAATAAATAAIGFAACSTPPASAATFEMGTPESSLYIRFSGTINFTFENQGTMGLDGLDTFQATYRYFFGGTSEEEATWGKEDISSFFFNYSPQSIYQHPQANPSDPGVAPLAFRATNESGEELWMQTVSAGYTTATIPKDCPPFAPPNSFCGLYTSFRTGYRSVRQIADDPTSVPVPEPTVIPGLMLGIGWLIKKKQASSMTVDN
ncbi:MULTISPECIES: PEP-CTERM sorting domain-containing protein [unclassified Microcoleus]|uniref:PEP-CTERM sorting domain-containing protein n=1 Tax=unclassified Microcoleus TaxID=2642155 RepID=UPI002FD60084